MYTIFIIMTTVDLYDVLNLESECTKQDIIKSYRKLVKKYHPDKPSGNNEIFELINIAFDTLSNEKKRNEYDSLKKVSDESSKKHHQRHSEFSEFVKLQENTQVDKDVAQINFKQQFNELNIKNKYDPTTENNKELSVEETTKLLEELQDLRENEDIEEIQEKIFENTGDFDLGKFNAAFEKAHYNINDDMLVKHKENPDALNDVDSKYYSSCDGNYGDIFTDVNDDKYYNINNEQEHKTTITQEHMNTIKTNDDVYNHNKTYDDYNKYLDELVQQRMADREKDLEMDMSEYKTDLDMNGYGILNKIGVDVSGQLELDDNIADKYEQLKQSRNK